MKKEDDLIYDLIFSEKQNFQIDVSDYIENIYDHEEFVKRIKSVLKKSKVKISTSELNVSSKTIIWILKVNK